MINSKNNHQIVFIYRDKLFFCNPNLNESKEFPLTAEIIKDLEVIDQEKLEKALREFLGNTKGKYTETLVILNKNTYFRTTIENPEISELENKAKIDLFSDLVPFNNIFVKQFSIHKKLEVIAINRDFYEPILDVLYKLDFKITMILPELVVQDYIGEASCTPEENTALLKTLGKLGAYDLLGSGHKLVIKNSSEIEPIKKQNQKLMALVIIFAVLIVILAGAIIFNNNRNNAYKASIKQAEVIEDVEPIKETILIDSGSATSSAETSNSASVSATTSNSAVLDLDQYKIRVLNGSGISGQAGIVKSNLEKAGFKNIDVGNAQKISSNKTMVLLIPTLPTEVRALILDVVESIGQEYSIQENSELNYDIVITTTAAE